MYFTTSSLYIESGCTAAERIAKIDQVISGLETAMIKAATGQNIEEYTVDNGQTKISAVYRSVDEIRKSIEGFLSLKEYYKSQINGRIVRLVDSKNIG